MVGLGAGLTDVWENNTKIPILMETTPQQGGVLIKGKVGHGSKSCGKSPAAVLTRVLFWGVIGCGQPHGTLHSKPWVFWG